MTEKQHFQTMTTSTLPSASYLSDKLELGWEAFALVRGTSGMIRTYFKRKAPEEDQGSRSDTNVLTVEITFDPTQCVEGAAAYDPEVDLQSVMEFGAEHYNMTDWKVL
jgi:hypothetical protein